MDQGKRIAVLVEQQYQEMEVWYPIYRLREAGCTVTVVGPEAGQTYPSKLGYPCKCDKAAKDCRAGHMYDLAAIGIAAACFAFAYLILWVLDRV